ncbi:MAG: DNA-nicking Smr family endonuclease, partial [Paraglaciecola sp.]
GDYPPDLILDLHGYKREEAKLEIAALIQAAQKHHAHCVCIVHGIGTHVLKKSIPNWLVQHPLVLGFHQAPLEWGGKGALLVLIDLPQINNKY